MKLVHRVILLFAAPMLLAQPATLPPPEPQPPLSVPRPPAPPAQPIAGIAAGGPRPVLQPGAQSAAPTLPAEPHPALQAGMLEEETNLNLDAALQSYQQVIHEFDLARHSAAQAIFRTAEVYRKMGRPEEARVYYARILREFPDQIELARLSHQHLFAPSPGAEKQLLMGREFARGPGGLTRPFWLGDSPSSGFSTSRPPSRWFPEQPIPPSVLQQRVESLKSEIELLEQARKELENKFEVGQATAADLRPIQREILQVQRDLDLWQGLAQTREETEKGPHAFDWVTSSEEEITPRRTVFPDQRLLAQAEKLYRLRAELSEAETRVRNAEFRHNSARTVDPVRLPSELAKDRMYNMLKTEYEGAALMGQVEAVAKSRERIKNWVEKILVPELETELQLAEEHRALIEVHVVKEEQKLKSLQKEFRDLSDPVSKLSAIISNLRIIEGAKDQWALENRKTAGDEPSIEEIVVYLRGNQMPPPVAGESYQPNPVGKQASARLEEPVGEFSAGSVLTLRELEKQPRRIR